MNNKTHVLVFMVVIVFFIAIALNDRITGNIINEKQSLKLGYCPTMRNYVEQIKDDDIISVEMNNAQEVLESLNEKQIDIAIIGRKAYSTESDSDGIILSDGYTLVNQSRDIILRDKLDDLEIHTYLSQEQIDKKYPNLNIEYHNSIIDAFNEGGVVLIDWNDWNDNYELIIPVYSDGSKDERFRTPFLYHNNKIDIKRVID